MGKLIKSHLARLLTLTAASVQLLASIYGIFWPKIQFDFLTTNLDRAVRPIPYLQCINICIALIVLAWEYPLPLFALAEKRARQNRAAVSTGYIWSPLLQIHASISARLLFLPLASLASMLLYQAGNAGLFYLVSLGFWFAAFCDGEVVMVKPWSLPRARLPANTQTSPKIQTTFIV